MQKSGFSRSYLFVVNNKVEWFMFEQKKQNDPTADKHEEGLGEENALNALDLKHIFTKVVFLISFFLKC